MIKKALAILMEALAVSDGPDDPSSFGPSLLIIPYVQPKQDDDEDGEDDEDRWDSPSQFDN